MLTRCSVTSELADRIGRSDRLLLSAPSPDPEFGDDLGAVRGVQREFTQSRD